MDADVFGSLRNNHMIIIKLKGGLGNQMFQYACGRHLAQKNSDVLKLDLGWFQPGGVAASDTVRPYALDAFAITAPIATDEDIARVRGPLFVLKAIVQKVLNKLWPVSSYVFDPRVLTRKGDVYLDGYFQSERYFKDSEPIIRKEFQLTNPLGAIAQNIAQEIESSNSVALHIRRGDYVSNADASAFHGICPPDYYHAAIKEIGKRVQEPKYFVFSDDIEWAKADAGMPGHAVYVSQKDIADYEELFLMSKCKHAIIANSSFSWWGAWLNENPNKIVIAPKRWVADPNVNTADVAPGEWIRI